MILTIHAPRSQRTSRTAKRVYYGEPTWRAAVAPCSAGKGKPTVCMHACWKALSCWAPKEGMESSYPWAHTCMGSSTWTEVESSCEKLDPNPGFRRKKRLLDTFVLVRRWHTDSNDTPHDTPTTPPIVMCQWSKQQYKKNLQSTRHDSMVAAMDVLCQWSKQIDSQNK